VPLAVDELGCRVERLHGGVTHHVCRVFHLEDLVGTGEGLVDIAFKDPIGACISVLRGLRVFGEQILEVEPAVGAWVDLDLQRSGGFHGRGEFLRQGDDPAHTAARV
jgi:hypothetical protein